MHLMDVMINCGWSDGVMEQWSDGVIMECDNWMMRCVGLWDGDMNRRNGGMDGGKDDMII